VTAFSLIPANIRVPLVLVQIDAAQGTLGLQPFKLLLIGQKLVTGAAAAMIPVRLTTLAEAIAAFGAGSELAAMAAIVFNSDQFLETWAFPFADPGGAIQATGTYTLTGTPTASGTLAFYVAGRRYPVTVSTASTPTSVASALVNLVQADSSAPANATANAGTVTITAKNAGTIGNEIDLRHSYNVGETIPTGLAVAISAMANGAGDIVLANAWAKLSDTQYNVICAPVTDATNLTALEAELQDRFGPIRNNAGLGITCASGIAGGGSAYANVLALGQSRNSAHVVLYTNAAEPMPTWEKAASAAIQMAASAEGDPALPFKDLPLLGTLPPLTQDRFTVAQMNALLLAGVSVTSTDNGGVQRILRAITTYKTNTSGVADPSFFDATKPLLTDRLRYDFRVYFSKYSRSKLMEDATRVGSGQSIITPNIAKGEMMALWRIWERNGWVEDAADFQSNLDAHINALDRSRLDIIITPKLVNGLGVLAAELQFS
jgi:phage tail sheath gpL-like